jgi:hypothetical protein
VQQGTFSGDHTGLLSTPSWRTVVGIADVSVPSFLHLFIQLVKDDIGQ